jgi:hypothetical protein
VKRFSRFRAPLHEYNEQLVNRVEVQILVHSELRAEYFLKDGGFFNTFSGSFHYSAVEDYWDDIF